METDSIVTPKFVQTTSTAKIQIHGFNDASMRRYGCCIYVRSFESGKVTVKLLAGNSKLLHSRRNLFRGLSFDTELYTDASSNGFGSLLLQRQDGGKFHTVAYYTIV